MDKSVIIQIINNLIVSRNIVFDQIVVFAMETDFKHIKDAFDIGDTYIFELKHFEETQNTELYRLVQVCKELEGTILSLMNLNGINENEVNFN